MPDRVEKVYSSKEVNYDFNRLKDLYKNSELNKKFEELKQDFMSGDKDIFLNRQYDDPEKYKRPFSWGRDAGEYPYVPRPSMFQVDPLVVSHDPRESNLAKRMLDLDPATKQRVKNITFGPTTESMDLMIESGLYPDRFETTNVLGVTHPSGQIGISPSLQIGQPVYDVADTLAHEIAHRSGHRERNANAIGEKMRDTFKFRSRYEK